VTADPTDDASYVFDPAQVRTYNIKVDVADLAMIDQHPAAEQWVPAQLEFEGTTYGPIKMRYKGSTGAFSMPCTQGEYDDPKAGKCSIKLGFDEVDEAMRFYGLKKLNFHSMNHDSSMLRDRLGYSLFRDSQVAAPRATHAKVMINGELEGLFVAVEQVDGRFTRARFGEGGEGNVYKEKWVSTNNEQDFVGALETNSDVHDVSGMLDFQTAVHTSADAAQKFLDRAYMMRYLAVDRVIVNDDGPMHFYCDPNSPPNYAVGNGNYYWYQSAQTKRFWLIPWDLDLSFDSTPWVTVEPEWSAKADCTCVAPPTMYAAQMPPSCDALVKHFVTWHDDYEHAVDDFLKGPFSDARVQQKLSAWIDQIQPFVTEAAGMKGAPSVATWKSGIQEVRDKITAQRMHRGYAY
jgi:spore coat protein H